MASPGGRENEIREALSDCVEAIRRARRGDATPELLAGAQRRAERALAPFGHLQPPLERDYLVTATWLRFLDDGEQEVYVVRAASEEEAMVKGRERAVSEGHEEAMGPPSLLSAEVRRGRGSTGEGR